MDYSDKAKAWRERAGFTVSQLSELSGFAPETIYAFERGKRPGGGAISDFSWQRYRLICSGVDQQIRTGQVFQW